MVTSLCHRQMLLLGSHLLIAVIGRYGNDAFATNGTSPFHCGLIGSHRVSCGVTIGTINHGPSLLSGHVYLGQLWQISLTYLVPYLVASYSAAKALLMAEDRQRRHPRR